MLAALASFSKLQTGHLHLNLNSLEHSKSTSPLTELPQINGTGDKMGPGHACQSTQSLEAYGVRHLAYRKLAFFPQLLCQTRQETVPRSLVSAHRSGMDPRTRSIVPATNLGSKQKQNPYGATHLLKFHLYLCIYIPRRVNIFQF